VTGTAAKPSAGSTAEQALGVVLNRLEAQHQALVDAATTAIFAEIPAYRGNLTPSAEQDVRLHVDEHISATLASLKRGGRVAAEDLLFIRRHAAQRVGEVSVANFIHAFQIGQRVLWDAAVGLADDDQSRQAVLSVVVSITQYFEVAITHAAEVYLEAEQLLSATGERLRRDALEELLAGSAITSGAPLSEAGLEASSECLVISAVQTNAATDAYALRNAAGSLARTHQRAAAPLTVVRHEEIVIVAPVRDGEVTMLIERLEAAQQRLAERGVPLAIGISTVHSGLNEVPVAYAEASEARGLLGEQPGVIALPAMTTFDYLVRQSNPTAARLVPAAAARFVAEDRTAGGSLVDTLRAYAAADLNVRRAAEELHIHVNTAHYRIAKIEERTGADLRSVSDVVGLLIAAQLTDQ
jgi:sugar diacid utilization regulator